jgi:hypothetical protein
VAAAALIALAFTAPVVRAASPFAVLEGDWTNAAQRAALPADVAAAPTPGRPWVDVQHARFVRLDAPALGELVYYLEWRRGGAGGEISRQRVWAFRGLDGDSPRMRFYLLPEPERWAAAVGDPARLAALAAAGLPEYPAGCELEFRRLETTWDGAIPAGACVIVARQSGRRMTIDARVTLVAGAWRYDEAGTLDDGTRAFVVPQGFRYEFERVPPGASPAGPATE